MSEPREWVIGSDHSIKSGSAVEESTPVIEKSAYIRLKAELWVARDSQLRTYDGLTEKADKYDDAIARATRAEKDLKTKNAAVRGLAGEVLILEQRIEKLRAAMKNLEFNMTCQHCGSIIGVLDQALKADDEVAK